MKKILSVLLILFTLSGLAQVRPYTIAADSVKFMSYGVNGSTFILRNNTKDTLGFLMNIGNGVTKFVRGLIRLNDSLYLIGTDTLNVNNSANGSFVTDTTIIWVKWPILIDSTTHPGDTTILFDITTFDSLLHKFIDTGSVIHNGYVLAYDSTNTKWIMVAPGGGAGPPFGRFGIEDIAGTQTRAVDMEDFGFTINNLDTFLLQNRDAATGKYGSIRMIKDGGGVPYLQMNAFNGTFAQSEFNVRGDAIDFKLVNSSFLMPYPTIDSTYNIPVRVNGVAADATGEITIDVSGGGTDTNFGNTDITFTGNRLHDLANNYMFIANNFETFLLLSAQPGSESVTLQSVNPTGGTNKAGVLVANTTSSGASVLFGASYNGGAEEANLSFSASSGVSTLNFSATLNDFSRGRIRADDYGNGTQLLPGLYILGVDSFGNFVELDPPVYTDNADALSNGLTQGMVYLVNSGGTYHVCLAVP